MPLLRTTFLVASMGLAATGAFAQAARPATPPAAAAPQPGTAAPGTATLAPGAAPVSSTPRLTTAAYGDWLLRCTATTTDARSCEVIQTLVVQGQTAPIAQVGIGREKPAEPLRLVVQLPVSVAIAPQVKVTLAANEPTLDLTFERCMPTGCCATLKLTDDALKRLRAHTEPGKIAFKDATDRDIALPFSLLGVAQALDALPKS